MAVDNQGIDFGQCKAAADYSAETNQFLCVHSTAAFVAKTQASKGAPILGILQNRPNSSQSAVVRLFGITKARVNSATHTAINPGDKLICSSGAGVRATTGTALNHMVIGRAIEAIGANTTGIITIYLNPTGAGSTQAQGLA
jgi:hypothetical protein